VAVIPKRTEQLIRRNIPDVPVEKITVIGQVPIPDLDIVNPHPLVVDLYDSLKVSAQNKFYEPSDWQTARVAMYTLNQQLTATYKDGSPRMISAVTLQVINQMFSQLMMTEGERRRARLEIERQVTGSGDAEVLTMADHFKKRFNAN
jgi:hypothetical protein